MDPFPLAVQLSRPYLPQHSIDALLAAHREGTNVSQTKELQIRLTACSFMQAACLELQFPVRTLGTAMMIYHRFHLFHSIMEFNTHDVSAACIFVASKMEDTAKKARDILMAVHAVRNPQSPDINPESTVLEDQRKRVLGLERMILETQSFDFRHRHPQPFIIKFARSLGMTTAQTRQAWEVSVDTYRTWTPLKLPPHATALACIVLSRKMEGQETDIGPFRSECEQAHIEDALEDLLDLYLHSKAYTSASDISSQDELMQIKSSLLKNSMSHQGRNGKHHAESKRPDNVSTIGDKGTCRFVLDPERSQTSSAMQSSRGVSH